MRADLNSHSREYLYKHPPGFSTAAFMIAMEAWSSCSSEMSWFGTTYFRKSAWLISAQGIRLIPRFKYFSRSLKDTWSNSPLRHFSNQSSRCSIGMSPLVLSSTSHTAERSIWKRLRSNQIQWFLPRVNTLLLKFVSGVWMPPWAKIHNSYLLLGGKLIRSYFFNQQFSHLVGNCWQVPLKLATWNDRYYYLFSFCLHFTKCGKRGNKESTTLSRRWEETVACQLV